MSVTKVNKSINDKTNIMIKQRKSKRMLWKTKIVKRIL